MDKYYNTLFPGSVLYGNQYNYKIEKVLGQGTFGITYLATVQLQGNLGRLPLKFHVTIKEFFMKEINGREESTVTSDSQGGMFDKYKCKFAQEARSLKSLNHPHIVKVMDFFEANNTYYYVMDYLCGGSIDDLIGRESFLAEDIAITYTRQIGEALGYMHENKILHLDMKPNNVMLNADGEAIVIDFGLSKQYDENGEPESSTTVGGGTIGYAPLEQSTHHDGHGFPVTMDVYALGATLYKMLVGVRAPEASSILNEGFPTQNLRQRNVSLETTKAIEKSMAPMKKDRFQSISEFIHHLPKVKSNIHVVDIDVESESTTIENNVVKSKKRANKEKQILSLAEVINAADNAFGRKDYPTALKYYIEAFKRDDSLGEIAYTIGEIYYRGHDIQEKTQKGGGRYASMNDYYHRCQKANPWFQKAYDLGIDTSNELLQKAQEFYDVKDYKHYHKALHECVDKNYKCEKAIRLLIESYEEGIGCKGDMWQANRLKKKLTTSLEFERSQEWSIPYQTIHEENSMNDPIKVLYEMIPVDGTSWRLGNTSFHLNELSRFWLVIILIFCNFGLLVSHGANLDPHIVNYSVINYDTQYGIMQFVCYIALVVTGFYVQREKIKNESSKEIIKIFLSLAVAFAIIGAISAFAAAIISSVVEMIFGLKSSFSVAVVVIRTLLSSIIASTILIIPEIAEIKKEKS